MTKEQLRNYRKIKDEHSQIEQRLRSLENRPESEEDILEPLRQFYREKLTALSTLQLEIERAIETLDYTEKKLVRLRYMDGLEWHQVCVAINYSWQQTHRIHARILKKIERI